MQMCNSPILSETDITSSVDNISLSIKTEIEKLTSIFNTKHNELNDETNKAILNLPFVKKIICGYENELLSNKNIEKYIVNLDKYFKEQISSQEDAMSNMFIIIKRQEKTITSLQESVCNLQETVSNLQDEINDIRNRLSSNLIKIEDGGIVDEGSIVEECRIVEEGCVIEECNIKLDIKEIQIDNYDELFFTGPHISISEEKDEDEEEKDEEDEDEEEKDEEEEEEEEEEKDEEEEEEEDEDEEEKDEEEEEEEDEDEEEKDEEEEEEEEEEKDEDEDEEINNQCVEQNLNDDNSIETENDNPELNDEDETNNKLSQEDIEDGEEVWEITIDDKVYFTNNETNGILYSNIDGDPGDEIGKMINGFPQFL